MPRCAIESIPGVQQKRQGDVSGVLFSELDHPGRASVVDFALSNPYWRLLIAPTRVRWAHSRASSSLSRSLSRVSSKHRGLYDPGSPGGFPGFGMSTSFPTFHRFGNCPLVRHPFIAVSTLVASPSTACLTISGGMPSGPPHLPDFILLAACLSSTGVKGSAGGACMSS